MNLRTLVMSGAMAAAVALPAGAHHSYAMFDATRTTTVEGTVSKFQWTNPHSWLYVNVADAAGNSKAWAVEMGAPGGLARQGWSPRTITPGMKVKVEMHPLKDGNPGGQFLSVVLPDGKRLGDAEKAAAADEGEH